MVKVAVDAVCAGGGSAPLDGMTHPGRGFLHSQNVGRSAALHLRVTGQSIVVDGGSCTPESDVQLKAYYNSRD